MIEAPEITTGQFQELKGLLNVLIKEVRALRCERLPANGKDIETLLKSAFEFFPGTGFTSSWLMEYSIDSSPESVQLFEAIKAAIGHKPTVNRLSRFLGKSVGTYGSYRLEIIEPHSRDGCLFCVSIMRDYVTT